MPVRKMQDVDGLSRRGWNNGSLWWLGAEIKTFVYLDSRWDCARVLQVL